MLWLQLSCDYKVTVYIQLADEKRTISNLIFLSSFVTHTGSEDIEDAKYCFILSQFP